MKEIIINIDNYNENSIKTTEGDNLNEVYKIYILKNKRRINLTNKIAVMAYVDSYGDKRSNILALNITNANEGEIELPITNIISEHNGKFACQIAIYGENNSLEQTAPFSLIVENNIFSKISNAAINSSDFHILSEAIKTTNTYGEKLKEGTENIELQYAKKLNKKLDKDGIVTMVNMGQDVKEAMTGGSVAVVGANSIDEINMKKNSVTPVQTNFIEENIENILNLDLCDIKAIDLTSSKDIQNKILCSNDSLIYSGETEHWIYCFIKLNLTTGKKYTVKAKSGYDDFSIALTSTSDTNAITIFNSKKADDNGYFTFTFIADVNTLFLRLHTKLGSFNVSELGLYEGEKYNDCYSLDPKIKIKSIQDGIVKIENLSKELQELYIQLIDNFYYFNKSIAFGNAENTIFNDCNITSTFVNGGYFALENKFFNTGRKYAIAYKVKADKDYFFSLKSADISGSRWNNNIFTTNRQTANIYTQGIFIYDCNLDGRLGFNSGSLGADTTNYEITLKIFDITDVDKKSIDAIDFLNLPPKTVILKQAINSESSTIQNKLKGKKIVFYGDSITQQNYYPPIIKKYYNCNVINLGVGGSMISAPNGDSTSFCNETRLQTIPKDTDFIFIMGGTNDWNRARIGTLDFSSKTIDTTNFKGGLAYVIKYISENIPNATLVVCTAIGGRGESAGVPSLYPLIDQFGQSTLDIRNATLEVANAFNIDTCDTWSCGINGFNRVKYISDTVHPTEEGANLIANYIINYLKKYAL